MCRLLRDAELLEAKLGKIDGAEELGAHIINIVKAKQVASRPKASTSASSGESTPA
jgi:vacuolar protein sorting-associated protein 54